MMIKYGRIWILSILACWLSACSDPGTGVSEQRYFSVDTYFKKEISNLNKRRLPVQKKVVQNGQQQTRSVFIKNWKKEFELFSQSDINKPAWRGGYTVLNNSGFIIYTAKTPDLQTRKIIIKKTGGKIKYIVIANSVKNFLYNSRERLTYYPDSLYRIEKQQQIRIIGQNTYLVEGRIK